MTKQQAEQLIRAALSELNLPLRKHQDLQAAVTTLATQASTENDQPSNEKKRPK